MRENAQSGCKKHQKHALSTIGMLAVPDVDKCLMVINATVDQLLILCKQFTAAGLLHMGVLSTYYPPGDGNTFRQSLHTTQPVPRNQRRTKKTVYTVPARMCTCCEHNRQMG